MTRTNGDRGPKGEMALSMAVMLFALVSLHPCTHSCEFSSAPSEQTIDPLRCGMDCCTPSLTRHDSVAILSKESPSLDITIDAGRGAAALESKVSLATLARQPTAGYHAPPLYLLHDQLLI